MDFNKVFIINEVGSIKNGNKLNEKSRKLLKTKKLLNSLKSSKLKKSKSKKIYKFQNLAKLKKKLSKNRNLSNFSTIKVGLRFLILNTKTNFNCL